MAVSTLSSQPAMHAIPKGLRGRHTWRSHSRRSPASKIGLRKTRRDGNIVKTQIRARLGAMMFLEYFIWGSWYVTLGTWLASSLHFTGQQIGLAAGTTAVGAMIAPFFVGLIADKLFATQRVLAALHLLGGILLFFASQQIAFNKIYPLLLL